MFLRIDRLQPKPLFKQIIDEIKNLVDQGTLEISQPLPSSRSLAKRLGVNRTTVTRAYEELQAIGYLSSRQGSYHRVQRRSREVEYNPDRHCFISWEKASSPNARKIHEIFLRYSPEKQPSAPPGQDLINISELDLDPRLFPMEEFRRCVNHVLFTSGSNSLQYGDHRGYLPLCHEIAKRLRLHGISVSEREILITNGAQQAIDLVIRMLAKEGKKVAIETPTYAAILPLLKFNGVDLLEIPMKKNGMDLNYLEEVLAKERVSFVYTIPNFQNPTGITTPHQHRERLLNICLRYRVPIVEDGFEEDMKYFGKVALPIKSIDEKNLVIYIGTFSKALFPGLRIGWVTADKECVSRLTAIKRFSDLGSGKLVQVVLHEFLKRGYYDRQLKRMHQAFRKRLQVALKTMDDVFPHTVSWTRPTGGYTIWVKLPRKWNEEKLHSHLIRYGVVVSPGSYYFPFKKSCEYFRLSIAKRNEEEITEAITRLGKALHNLDKEN
ncbi:MAG: PLP-dependent aminotransferase family protein [Candidatus Aminicenantes bacterium]|nr:PLP-dependent aminotransferase family protein [Candidatus Aminicenantes bacterium]MDH5384199.1 PLP-dependent aminotransferase family protein [Candidatus Aminicenantes bacterium]MDH5745091.1 PLP-dependent aminotransferase family protein [Candidatus Aminicenantes bacterium]